VVFTNITDITLHIPDQSDNTQAQDNSNPVLQAMA